MNNTSYKFFLSHTFYTGLLLLVASLSLSVFMMSVSQFIIVGAWLLNGDLIQKFKTAFTNKVVLVLISVYVIHLIGLLYTSDFTYALKDIRVKLPLLALPVIFSTTEPLSKEKFNWLLRTFVLGIFVATVLGWCVYLGIIHKKINDIREISLFISQIRLSLFICLSVFACIYFIIQSEKIVSAINFAIVLLIGWFIAFLFLIESVTGLGILFFTGICFVFYSLLKNKNRVYKISAMAFVVLLIAFCLNYFKNIQKEVAAFNTVELFNLDLTTAEGNMYSHNLLNRESENGHPVWIYVCEKELEREWNKKSNFNYNGKNKNGDDLRFGLIRFLASKGMRKDAGQVILLSDEEIKAVENGIANVSLLHENVLRSRLKTIAWELHMYNVNRNPSGHSVAMRIEFWTTAIRIIEKHKWKGVGTGDVQRAFGRMYAISKSPLSKEWRLRAHNQYLSIGVAFGIPAMIWFVVSLVLPGLFLKRQNDFLYVSFFIVAVMSMLTEDTLETQAGVTFFALFNCLYLFLKPADE